MDGEDLVGLDAPDLLAAALGDVGRSFEVEVTIDGARTPLTLTRVYLDDGQREGASGQREADPDAWVD